MERSRGTGKEIHKDRVNGNWKQVRAPVYDMYKYIEYYWCMESIEKKNFLAAFALV